MTTTQVSCSILIPPKMTEMEMTITCSTKWSRLKRSPQRRPRSKKRRHSGKRWEEYSFMMHMPRCSGAKRLSNTSRRISLRKYKQTSYLLSKNLKKFLRICSENKPEQEISAVTKTRTFSEIFLVFCLNGIILTSNTAFRFHLNKTY